jgi:hypothetical protein
VIFVSLLLCVNPINSEGAEEQRNLKNLGLLGLLAVYIPMLNSPCNFLRMSHTIESMLVA